VPVLSGDMSNPSLIKVNFIKKPKKLKLVVGLGFETPENDPEVKKVEAKQDDESQFFSDAPEELMEVRSPMPSERIQVSLDEKEETLLQDVERIASPEPSVFKKVGKVENLSTGTIFHSFVSNYTKASAEEPLEKAPAISAGQEERDEFPMPTGDHNTEFQILEWNQKAIQLAENQDYSQALNYFERILYFQPANYRVHEYKAQIYLELGMFLMALKSIETSIQCNSSWYINYLTLARCQREMGELELSLDNYHKSKELYLFTKNQNSKRAPDSPPTPSFKETLVENSATTSIQAIQEEKDEFLRDLFVEMKEVEELNEQLKAKQQLYQEKLQNSKSDDLKEINTCFCNLSLRARSRVQLDALQETTDQNQDVK
jgi:tetratricopeptide (TPR) repeat protein